MQHITNNTMTKKTKKLTILNLIVRLHPQPSKRLQAIQNTFQIVNLNSVSK